MLVDPYDEKGKPVYVEAWERLGFDREKLEPLAAGAVRLDHKSPRRHIRTIVADARIASPLKISHGG